MAKKKVPMKCTKRGLAGAAENGGEALRVKVEKMSIHPPLRDMYAAFALSGLLANPAFDEKQFRTIASNAWRISDMVLAAREAK